MILSIEKEYLFSIIPALVKGFKDNTFTASEKLEEDYEAKLEVQARSGSASGRDTFPVVVDIYGAIVKHTSYDYIGTQSYGRYLRQLDAHPSVSAIILDINSGGGMVSGTAELAHIIRGIEKPIVAYTNGYMCSAAYWIAAACDKVVSSPFADAIGSIGTMLHTQDYSQMFEKWGAKIYEVYAPESSEKNKLRRSLAKVSSPATKSLHSLFFSLLSGSWLRTLLARCRPAEQTSRTMGVYSRGLYIPLRVRWR